MVRRKILFFLILFIGFAFESACSFAKNSSFEELCPGILSDQKITPSLTDLEKSLVCGVKEDAKHYSTEAWRTIPFQQLQFHLKTFLQDRGYHHPEFKKDGGKVWISPGEQQKLTQINLEGAPTSVHMERKRKVIGEVLTPRLLETLEKWVGDQLLANGYPCPQVKTLASTTTGEVRVLVEPGPLLNIIEVTEEENSNLDSEVLSRYRAFHLNQPFNGHLLTVTEDRTNSTGIVEANHFSVRCRPEGAALHHSYVLGPPRFLSFGAGVNTEGILRGKATWKNVRVGKTASLFDFSAIGSARMQTAWVKANWFLGPGGSRLSVAPLIQLTHENLEQKETLSAREQFGLSTTLDQEGVGNLFFSGPTLDQFRTFRGVGIPYFNYLSLESRWAMKSHEFEYYASNPKTGFNLGLTTNLSNIQKLNLRGELLWNFKNYDPALWIFAVRGGFASLIADGGENPETRFPGDFFQYLGGSTDLRGFGLQELPREGTPRALTAGFLGFEARLSNTLPAGVDPFVFVDLGMLGTQSMGFNSTLYWSPGAGIRWASPIGVIRTTAARGFSHSPQDHWQFYFNYGEEF